MEDNYLQRGEMYSMLGNLCKGHLAEYFKVGDNVEMIGVGLFMGRHVGPMMIKEIKEGKGGYMVFEREDGKKEKLKYDEVLDGFNLKKLN